jgi:hypothetical protein
VDSTMAQEVYRQQGWQQRKCLCARIFPHLLCLGLNDLCPNISCNPRQMKEGDESYSQHPQCFVVGFVVGPWGSRAPSGSLQ